MIEVIKFIIVSIFVIISCITDYREYKIKNSVVIIFLIIGLVINLMTGGLDIFLQSVYGMLIPLILFPLFMLRMLGAGDIKALCAIGSIVCFKLSVCTIIFSIIGGGMIALLFMIFRKNSIERFKMFFKYLKLCFILRKLLAYDKFSDSESIFRFSFGIALGFILTVLKYYNVF